MRGLVLVGWVLLLAFLLWPLLRWMLRQGSSRPRLRALRDELVKDPVCQTYIVRSRAVVRSVGGSPQYFCSPECAARFIREGRG